MGNQTKNSTVSVLESRRGCIVCHECCSSTSPWHVYDVWHCNYLRKWVDWQCWYRVVIVDLCSREGMDERRTSRGASPGMSFSSSSVLLRLELGCHHCQKPEFTQQFNDFCPFVNFKMVLSNHGLDVAISYFPYHILQFHCCLSIFTLKA